MTIGHATKLSAIPGDRLDAIGRRLAQAGVAVTVLPATDLFLMGHGHEHSVPRGVAPVHRLLRQVWRARLPPTTCSTRSHRSATAP